MRALCEINRENFFFKDFLNPVCKLIETHLYSAAISRVRHLHHELNTVHTRNSSWIRTGFDKFKTHYLCTKKHNSFKGSCKSDIALFTWRVTWNYAYSPFKLSLRKGLSPREKDISVILFICITCGLINIFIWFEYFSELFTI